MVPTKVFLTKGVGRHPHKLESFELALREAGISFCNIVNVSSILPPHCEIVPKSKGVEMLKPGQITFCVLARNASDEPNRLISSSIGVALPADNATYGYLSEVHEFGMTEAETGEYAEDMAASMLASTLGIKFDMAQSWDEKEELFKISGKIYRTTNSTQSAVCDKGGSWTTVLAAAVFCDYKDEKQVEQQHEKKSLADILTSPFKKKEEHKEALATSANNKNDEKAIPPSAKHNKAHAYDPKSKEHDNAKQDPGERNKAKANYEEKK